MRFEGHESISNSHDHDVRSLEDYFDLKVVIC